MDCQRRKELLNFKHKTKNPLYRNALYLTLSSVCGGGFGIIFWLLAARIYSPADLGVASAMIATINVLVLIAKFGFDFSIIRFFSTMEKDVIYNTAANLVMIAGILLGLVFLFNVNILSPQLAMLNGNLGLIFMIVLVATLYSSLSGTVFIAARKSKLYFFQNLSMGIRILFLFPFICLGSVGIFLAFGLSTLLLLGITIFFLYYIKIPPRFIVDKNFISASFRFSLSNYINNILVIAPYHLLPIVILNVLGRAEAAYYYIDFSIISLLLTLPSNLSTSLFVEGSQGAPTKKSFLKAVFISYLILIPLLIILFIGGEPILSLVNTEYIQGFDLLRVLCISALFMTFITLYYSVMRIQKNLNGLILLGGLIFLILICSSYFFMTLYGIVGVGYGWLFSSIIGFLVIIISTKGLKTI